jgi:hypothetical protein
MTPSEHHDAITALISEGRIPAWERDQINFPLSRHPFLSGKDKFDAMLEIERVATKLEWFFYPLTLKDIP